MFIESAIILAIVVLGGLGSQIGVVFAAIAIIGGFELFRELTVFQQFLPDGTDPVHYRMLVVGLAMVLIMVWRPRGLVSSASRPSSSRRGRRSRAISSRRARLMATAAKTPVLAVEHLTMRFGGLTAVNDLSFAAARARSPR